MTTDHDEYYACRFCSNIFDTSEEREHCEINCQLDAIWHIYEESAEENFWGVMAMSQYYHLTVDDIEQSECEVVEDIGSGGNYL